MIRKLEIIVHPVLAYFSLVHLPNKQQEIIIETMNAV
jgi:hypothetical protein